MSDSTSLRQTVAELANHRREEPGDLAPLLRLLDAIGSQATRDERPGAAESAKILAESIESAIRSRSHPGRIGVIIDSAIERLRRKCIA